MTKNEVPKVFLQGWTVLRVWRGSLYLRIPKELQAPAGPCECRYCKTHPRHVPTWDTMGVPLKPGAKSWTCHAPEWSEHDKVQEPRETTRLEWDNLIKEAQSNA